VGVPDWSLFFSSESIDFTLSIFARKETPSIDGVAALTGKTLATYPGYSWNRRFPDYLPETRSVMAENIEDMDFDAALETLTGMLPAREIAD